MAATKKEVVTDPSWPPMVLPVWQKLEGCKHVLVSSQFTELCVLFLRFMDQLAGCGGGYDIFSGLPLYFALTKSGKRCSLANLSFSQVETFEGNWIHEKVCLEVTAETKRNSSGRWNSICMDFVTQGLVCCRLLLS